MPAARVRCRLGGGFLPQYLLHCISLIDANFEDRPSARFEHNRERRRDGAVGIKPVHTAVKRSAWIVIRHLRCKSLYVCTRYIWRVGDQNIKLA